MGKGGTPRRGGGEPRRVAGRTQGEAAEARRAPGGRARAKGEPDFPRKGRTRACQARAATEQPSRSPRPPSRARSRRALLRDVPRTQAFRTVTE